MREGNSRKARFRNVVRFFQLKSPNKQRVTSPNGKDLDFSSLAKELKADADVKPLSSATLIGALESDSDDESIPAEAANSVKAKSTTFSFFNNLHNVLGSASPEKETSFQSQDSLSPYHKASDDKLEAANEEPKSNGSECRPAENLSKVPELQKGEIPYTLNLNGVTASSGRSSVERSFAGWRTTDKVQSLKELYRQFVMQSEQQRLELLQYINSLEATIKQMQQQKSELRSTEEQEKSFHSFANETEQKLGALTMQVSELLRVQEAKDKEVLLAQECQSKLQEERTRLVDELQSLKLREQELSSQCQVLQSEKYRLEKLTTDLQRENLALNGQIRVLESASPLPAQNSLASSKRDERPSSVDTLDHDCDRKLLGDVTPSFRTFAYSSNASLSSLRGSRLATQSPTASVATARRALVQPASAIKTPTPSTISQISNVISHGSGKDYISLVAATEQRLREITAEKDKLSAEYSRMPMSARSNVHRMRRMQVEERLEQLDRDLGTVRSQLRFLHAI